MTTKMKKRTRTEAKRLMWEYYRQNKAILPHSIKYYREEIICELMRGSQRVANVFALFPESVD